MTDRKALAKAMAALEDGDMLLVTRLDRPPLDPRRAEYPRYDQQSRGQAQIACRSMVRHDHPAGRIMIAVLGGLATFERHLIKVRPEGASRHRREGLGSAAS